MKIKCIDNNFEEKYLTIDKIYDVEDEGETLYSIKCDNGEIRAFTKCRFIPVKEENKMKVKCINNSDLEELLTMNKVYPLMSENKTTFTIVDNNNELSTFSKRRFIPVEEDNKMKVKCIDNKDIRDCLTIDKIYKVLNETENFYHIIDDKDEKTVYAKNRFIVTEESTIIDIANEIAELVEKKDKDYNSAFSKTLKEYGNVAYFLRIDDKLNRLKSLLLDNKDAEVNESVEDTLKDIVGYTLLMLKEKRA